MKKAIVYKKDRIISTAQGEQKIASKGDIWRFFDDQEEKPNGFLFSHGYVEVVDVEENLSAEDAVFVHTPAIPGGYSKSGEQGRPLSNPPMVDNGSGTMVVDSSWTKTDFVAEVKIVKTDQAKKAAREASKQSKADKKSNKEAAKALLAASKDDLKNPTVAKLAPIVEALVTLLED